MLFKMGFVTKNNDSTILIQSFPISIDLSTLDCLWTKHVPNSSITYNQDLLNKIQIIMTK